MEETNKEKIIGAMALYNFIRRHLSRSNNEFNAINKDPTYVLPKIY